MNHHIGEQYRYPESNKRFKLVAKRKYAFLFECGHWCTDSVFSDLIRTKTGIQVYKDNQLKLI